MKRSLICAALMVAASSTVVSAQTRHVRTTQLRCRFQASHARHARILITNEGVRPIPRSTPFVVTQMVRGIAPREATVTLSRELARGQAGETRSPFTADPIPRKPATFPCRAVADWLDVREFKP